jgi:hypothetical protein
MIHAERLRTVYLLAVIVACCVLITGCTKPEDVDCIDLSGPVTEEPIICTDGKEPQLCMSPAVDNCGYYVNSLYIPCRSCTCDAATRLAVALCLGMSPSVDLSFTDPVAEDPVMEKAEALLDAMEHFRESY